MISYKGDKIVAIWQQYKSFVHIFTAHAQKRLFRNFRSKIGPCHSLWRPRFPIRRVCFHYPMTFSAYIWCLCTIFIWFCDLDLRPFDLDRASRIKSLIRETYVLILSVLRLSVLSYVWLNLITLPSPGMVSAHAPCHVTYHRGGGGKNNPHFWNPWP